MMAKDPSLPYQEFCKAVRCDDSCQPELQKRKSKIVNALHTGSYIKGVSLIYRIVIWVPLLQLRSSPEWLLIAD